MCESLGGLDVEVLRMLLDGDDEVLAILREQLKRSSIKNRKFTGVGFFTRFDVTAEAPRLGTRRFTFGDVIATIDGLRHGAGFELFVDHGCIDVLEGYCYDEEWPLEIGRFELEYEPDGKRDWDVFRQKLSG